MHKHKWVALPCKLTATWLYRCRCGAERMVEADQDGSSTVTVTTTDGQTEESHYLV